MFERAAQLYRTLGDVRGEAESLFWIGTFHQVVRQDDGAALRVFERSHMLARQAGDKLTESYVLRHLGFAAHNDGRVAQARELLAESTSLRREIGFLPGVAANLIGLAHLAGEAGQRDEALVLLAEADSIAEASGAHGVLRWVEQARAQL